MNNCEDLLKMQLDKILRNMVCNSKGKVLTRVQNKYSSGLAWGDKITPKVAQVDFSTLKPNK